MGELLLILALSACFTWNLYLWGFNRRLKHYVIELNAENKDLLFDLMFLENPPKYSDGDDKGPVLGSPKGVTVQ